MPITHHTFEDSIFFAKESGVISGEDVASWAEWLRECAEKMPTPIVAVIDALDVTMVSKPAFDVFSKASYTPNVIGIVVATNSAVNVTARNIGLLSKRGLTTVFSNLEEAQNHALELLRAEVN